MTGYSIDQAALAKGNYVYHIPIDKAMEIAAKEYQDPAAGHAKLAARLDAKTKQQSFE